jgi:hypothetical protein
MEQKICPKCGLISEKEQYICPYCFFDFVANPPPQKSKQFDEKMKEKRGKQFLKGGGKI